MVHGGMSPSESRRLRSCASIRRCTPSRAVAMLCALLLTGCLLLTDNHPEDPDVSETSTPEPVLVGPTPTVRPDFTEKFLGAWTYAESLGHYACAKASGTGVYTWDALGFQVGTVSISEGTETDLVLVEEKDCQLPLELDKTGDEASLEDRQVCEETWFDADYGRIKGEIEYKALSLTWNETSGELEEVIDLYIIYDPPTPYERCSIDGTAILW